MGTQVSEYYCFHCDEKLSGQQPGGRHATCGHLVHPMELHPAYAKDVREGVSKPVVLCKCGKVLETPAMYGEHCREFPEHFTKSE